jgi:repressor LexA
MSSELLTTRQREVLQFIRDEIANRGVPPTRREICDRFNLNSINAAESQLFALQRKGFIALMPRISRGIRVLHGEE